MRDERRVAALELCAHRASAFCGALMGAYGVPHVFALVSAVGDLQRSLERIVSSTFYTVTPAAPNSAAGGAAGVPVASTPPPPPLQTSSAPKPTRTAVVSKPAVPASAVVGPVAADEVVPQPTRAAEPSRTVHPPTLPSPAAVTAAARSGAGVGTPHQPQPPQPQMASLPPAGAPAAAAAPRTPTAAAVTTAGIAPPPGLSALMATSTSAPLSAATSTSTTTTSTTTPPTTSTTANVPAAPRSVSPPQLSYTGSAAPTAALPQQRTGPATSAAPAPGFQQMAGFQLPLFLEEGAADYEGAGKGAASVGVLEDPVQPQDFGGAFGAVGSPPPAAAVMNSSVTAPVEVPPAAAAAALAGLLLHLVWRPQPCRRQRVATLLLTRH